MNNQQNGNCADHSDGMPGLFSVFDPIRHNQMKGIAPDVPSKLERNAVFDNIPPGFLGDPIQTAYFARSLRYCMYNYVGVKRWSTYHNYE